MGFTLDEPINDYSDYQKDTVQDPGSKYYTEIYLSEEDRTTFGNQIDKVYTVLRKELETKD